MFTLIVAGIIVIISAVIIDNKNKKMRDETDYYSMSYRHGYWDGVQASESGEVGIEDGVYITKHKAKSSKARHRTQGEVPQTITPELPQTI